MVGIAFYGVVKAFGGRCKLPLFPVGVAEIVVDRGIGGNSRQGLLERRNGVVETPVLFP